MKVKTKIINLIINICILIFVVTTSVQRIVLSDTICIEAEDAINIISNLIIIEDEGCSGGKAIESIQQSHQMDSYAQYNLNITQTGKYYVWARTNWDQGCGNTFALGIDGKKPFIFGNDDIYHSWHWVRCGTLDIKSGKHNLYIWNEEYKAKLDKLVLSTNASYVPKGKGENSDFRIDFENDDYSKIMSNNNDLWCIVTKNKNSNYFLKEIKTNTPEFALVNSLSNEYYFYFKFKTISLSDNNSVSFVFNYKNRTNYNEIKLIDSSIFVNSVLDGTTKTLERYDQLGEIFDTNYCNFSLFTKNNIMTFRLNDITIGNIKGINKTSNKIGIGSDKGNILFDDIEYKTNLTPIGFRSSWTWDLIAGENSMLGTIQHLKSEQDKYALLISGKEYWSNYSITAAVKATKNAGICFNVQDSASFYLYKVGIDPNNKTYLSIDKFKNGEYCELSKKYIDLYIGEWYKLEVRRNCDSIVAYIDDYNILECVDTSYNYGYIGLYSKNNKEYSTFDDIKVMPSKGGGGVSQGKNILYTFTTLENASYDFCDWLYSSSCFEKNSGHSVIFKKDLFEEIKLINKKTFKGDLKLELYQDPSVPKDVNLNFLLEGGNDKDYLIKLENGDIKFLRNGKLLKSKRNNSNRRYLRFEILENSVLKIYDETNNLLFFQDEYFPNIYQIGISFTGIGCFTTDYFLININADTCFMAQPSF